MPVEPPAPGMFSTTTDWPRGPCVRSATRRAIASADPPAGNATITVMGRVGYVWALATPASAAIAGAPAARAHARAARQETWRPPKLNLDRIPHLSRLDCECLRFSGFSASAARWHAPLSGKRGSAPFLALVKSEIARWGPVIKAANVKLDRPPRSHFRPILDFSCASGHANGASNCALKNFRSSRDGLATGPMCAQVKHAVTTRTRHSRT